MQITCGAACAAGPPPQAPGSRVHRRSQTQHRCLACRAKPPPTADKVQQPPAPPAWAASQGRDPRQSAGKSPINKWAIALTAAGLKMLGAYSPRLAAMLRPPDQPPLAAYLTAEFMDRTSQLASKLNNLPPPRQSGLQAMGAAWQAAQQALYLATQQAPLPPQLSSTARSQGATQLQLEEDAMRGVLPDPQSLLLMPQLVGYDAGTAAMQQAQQTTHSLQADGRPNEGSVTSPATGASGAELHGSAASPAILVNSSTSTSSSAFAKWLSEPDPPDQQELLDQGGQNSQGQVSWPSADSTPEARHAFVLNQVLQLMLNPSQGRRIPPYPPTPLQGWLNAVAARALEAAAALDSQTLATAAGVSGMYKDHGSQGVAAVQAAVFMPVKDALVYQDVQGSALVLASWLYQAVTATMVLYMSNAVGNTPDRLIVLLAVADDLAAGLQPFLDARVPLSQELAVYLSSQRLAIALELYALGELPVSTLGSLAQELQAAITQCRKAHQQQCSSSGIVVGSGSCGCLVLFDAHHRLCDYHMQVSGNLGAAAQAGNNALLEFEALEARTCDGFQGLSDDLSVCALWSYWRQAGDEVTDVVPPEVQLPGALYLHRERLRCILHVQLAREWVSAGVSGPWSATAFVAQVASAAPAAMSTLLSAAADILMVATAVRSNASRTGDRSSSNSSHTSGRGKAAASSPAASLHHQPQHDTVVADTPLELYPSNPRRVALTAGGLSVQILAQQFMFSTLAVDQLVHEATAPQGRPVRKAPAVATRGGRRWRDSSVSKSETSLHHFDLAWAVPGLSARQLSPTLHKRYTEHYRHRVAAAESSVDDLCSRAQAVLASAAQAAPRAATGSTRGSCDSGTVLQAFLPVCHDVLALQQQAPPGWCISGPRAAEWASLLTLSAALVTAAAGLPSEARLADGAQATIPIPNARSSALILGALLADAPPQEDGAAVPLGSTLPLDWLLQRGAHTSSPGPSDPTSGTSGPASLRSLCQQLLAATGAMAGCAELGLTAQAAAAHTTSLTASQFSGSQTVQASKPPPTSAPASSSAGLAAALTAVSQLQVLVLSQQGRLGQAELLAVAERPSSTLVGLLAVHGCMKAKGLHTSVLVAMQSLLALTVEELQAHHQQLHEQSRGLTSSAAARSQGPPQLPAGLNLSNTLSTAPRAVQHSCLALKAVLLGASTEDQAGDLIKAKALGEVLIRGLKLGGPPGMLLQTCAVAAAAEASLSPAAPQGLRALVLQAAELAGRTGVLLGPAVLAGAVTAFAGAGLQDSSAALVAGSQPASAGLTSPAGLLVSMEVEPMANIARAPEQHDHTSEIHADARAAALFLLSIAARGYEAASNRQPSPPASLPAAAPFPAAAVSALLASCSAAGDLAAMEEILVMVGITSASTPAVGAQSTTGAVSGSPPIMSSGQPQQVFDKWRLRGRPQNVQQPPHQQQRQPPALPVDHLDSALVTTCRCALANRQAAWLLPQLATWHTDHTFSFGLSQLHSPTQSAAGSDSTQLPSSRPGTLLLAVQAACPDPSAQQLHLACVLLSAAHHSTHAAAAAADPMPSQRSGGQSHSTKGGVYPSLPQLLGYILDTFCAQAPQQMAALLVPVEALVKQCVDLALRDSRSTSDSAPAGMATADALPHNLATAAAVLEVAAHHGLCSAAAVHPFLKACLRQCQTMPPAMPGSAALSWLLRSVLPLLPEQEGAACLDALWQECGSLQAPHAAAMTAWVLDQLSTMPKGASPALLTYTPSLSAALCILEALHPAVPQNTTDPGLDQQQPRPRRPLFGPQETAAEEARASSSTPPPPLQLHHSLLRYLQAAPAQRAHDVMLEAALQRCAGQVQITGSPRSGTQAMTAGNSSRSPAVSAAGVSLSLAILASAAQRIVSSGTQPPSAVIDQVDVTAVIAATSQARQRKESQEAAAAISPAACARLLELVAAQVLHNTGTHAASPPAAALRASETAWHVHLTRAYEQALTVCGQPLLALLPQATLSGICRAYLASDACDLALSVALAAPAATSGSTPAAAQLADMVLSSPAFQHTRLQSGVSVALVELACEAATSQLLSKALGAAQASHHLESVLRSLSEGAFVRLITVLVAQPTAAAVQQAQHLLGAWIQLHGGDIHKHQQVPTGEGVASSQQGGSSSSLSPSSWCFMVEAILQQVPAAQPSCAVQLLRLAAFCRQQLGPSHPEYQVLSLGIAGATTACMLASKRGLPEAQGLAVQLLSDMPVLAADRRYPSAEPGSISAACDGAYAAPQPHTREEAGATLCTASEPGAEARLLGACILFLNRLGSSSRAADLGPQLAPLVADVAETLFMRLPPGGLIRAPASTQRQLSEAAHRASMSLLVSQERWEAALAAHQVWAAVRGSGAALSAETEKALKQADKAVKQRQQSVV